MNASAQKSAWNRFWFGKLENAWCYSVFRILWSTIHITFVLYILYWSTVEASLPPLPYPGVLAIFSGIPHVTLITLCIVHAIAGTCTLLGFCTRAMQWVVFAVSIPLFFHSVSLYQNHYGFYLCISAYAALMPSERFYSIDSWLRSKQMSKAKHSAWQKSPASLLPQRLVLMQLSFLYFFAAINKLEPTWWQRWTTSSELIVLSEESWHTGLWEWMLANNIAWLPIGLIIVLMLILSATLFVANRFPILVLLGCGLHIAFEYTLPILEFSRMCIFILFLALFPLKSPIVKSLVHNQNS